MAATCIGFELANNHSMRNTLIQSIEWPDGQMRWFLLVLFIVLILVTIFSNVITLVAIGRFRHLRTRAYVLVASLSAADLANALSMVIFVCRGLILMPLQCDVVFINDVLTLIELYPVAVQAVHSGTIAVDRYICVVWPLRYAALLTPQVMTCMVVGAWMSSLLAVLIHVVFFIGDHDPHQSRINATFDFYSKVVVSVLMTAMLIGCYAKMMSISRQQKRRIEEATLPEERTRKKERKSTVIMLVVVCSHVVLWSPYLVLFWLLKTSTRVTLTIQRLKPIFVLIGMTNSCVIFFVYAWMSRDLRCAYATLLGFKQTGALQVASTDAWK